MSLSPSTLKFLEHLALNNHKDWFHEHRELYDVAKWEFLDLIEKLTEKISDFDPLVTDLDPKKAMFRINRDIRFSKNKSPYKPNFWAVIAKWWRKSPYAAYYIHIHPGNNSFIGGWLYRPDKDVIAVVRDNIAKHHKRFTNIISEKHFVDTFERPLGQSLMRPPKGSEKDHPAIDWIKMKDWYVLHGVKDKELTSKNFLAQATQICKTLHDYNTFFNRAIKEIVGE